MSITEVVLVAIGMLCFVFCLFAWMDHRLSMKRESTEQMRLDMDQALDKVLRDSE